MIANLLKEIKEIKDIYLKEQYELFLKKSIEIESLFKNLSNDKSVDILMKDFEEIKKRVNDSKKCLEYCKNIVIQNIKHILYMNENGMSFLNHIENTKSSINSMKALKTVHPKFFEIDDDHEKRNYAPTDEELKLVERAEKIIENKVN